MEATIDSNGIVINSTNADSLDRNLRTIISDTLKHFIAANLMLVKECEDMGFQDTHESRRSVTLRYINLLSCLKRNFNPCMSH
jgi:hypothetical protein